MKRPGFEADKRDIILVNLKTGETSNITEGYDGSVREYVWAPDNRTIYFTSDSQGRVGIYKVDIKAREVVRLYQNGVCSNLGISKDGGFLIYGFQNSTNPLEIFNFDLKRNNPIKLTSLNESVISEIEMNPAEDVNFRGAGGDMIHGFIVKPPFFDKTKKYPMIYIIHGGPQGATHDRLSRQEVMSSHQ
jgi:dipeptidyl aminopeptidase/acylaminoacyl peptidase